MPSHSNKPRSFTLIELLVVIAPIVALAFQPVRGMTDTDKNMDDRKIRRET